MKLHVACSTATTTSYYAYCNLYHPRSPMDSFDTATSRANTAFASKSRHSQDAALQPLVSATQIQRFLNSTHSLSPLPNIIAHCELTSRPLKNWLFHHPSPSPCRNDLPHFQKTPRAINTNYNRLAGGKRAEDNI